MRLSVTPAGLLAIVVCLVALMGFAIFGSLRNRSPAPADGPPPAPSGAAYHPIAHWDFEEEKGNTSEDTSGNGKMLTISGNAARDPGVVGKHSLSLSNSAYATALAGIIDTTHSYTVMACVKPRDLTGYRTFVSVDGDQVSGFYLQIRDDSHKFAFSILPADMSDNSHVQVVAAKDMPQANQWYHLAGVYDSAAGTMSLYVNGVLQDSRPVTTPWRASGQTVIGRGKYGGNPVDFADADVDDVRLYDSALSGPDIAGIAKGDLGAAAVPTKTSSAGGPAALAVDLASASTAVVSPVLYGLMTEEISHSYDGGLYGELIQNRAFKDSPTEAEHWSLVQDAAASGGLALDTSHPLSDALPVSLRMTAKTASNGHRVGAANDGYWGVPVKPDTAYRASLYARASADFTGPLTIDVESQDGGTVYASAAIPKLTDKWHRYAVTLHTGHLTPSLQNRFVVSAAGPGTVWLNVVSLFGPTYHNRENGNRVDLMEKLAAMKPAFLRMPGGNYLEGNTIAERFDWKKTIGDITDRPGHQGPWGYRSSDGMGLLEFLEWCEDLKMQPVLAVFAGFALHGEHANPGPELQPYVQDALDEIEYATGDIHTKWGARRAADGHPAPFPITYVEVGNEDFFDHSGSYDGRFAQFYDAIKKKYPKIQVIATTGVKSRTPDVIDEHYYRKPDEFERDASHYDGYNRKGPKIFVGEWASQEGSPTPNWNAAVGDAAWLTGIERNSDIVVMEAYAPLLVNVNPGGRQWGTNLIGYDALNSYGSPSYSVQQVFATNHGDRIANASLTGGSQIFESVTRDSATGTLYIKLVNASDTAQTVHVSITGAHTVAPVGTAITLAAADPNETNAITDPTHIVPVQSRLDRLGSSFDYRSGPRSVAVLRIEAKS